MPYKRLLLYQRRLDPDSEIWRPFVWYLEWKSYPTRTHRRRQ